MKISIVLAAHNEGDALLKTIQRRELEELSEDTHA